MISRCTFRAALRIDKNAVESNFHTIKRFTKSKICCVVKANAYGHGAVNLSRIYEALGADFFAVSNIREAMELREAGIKLPVLVLGYTPVNCADLLAENDISQCIYSKEYGFALSEQAKRKNLRIKIHVKLDTGMGRIGFLCRNPSHDELSDAVEVARLSNFITEGVFTHFAVADDGAGGDDYTRLQFERFSGGIKFLEANGIRFELRHCANSAALFDYPQFHLDMVRAGIVLYGMKPSGTVRHLPKLEPIASFVSVISDLKKVYAGESIGYGRTFVAAEDMKVATVPVGYADGFFRSNGNGAYSVIIHGKEAPVLGWVCMDQFMADVSGIECSAGDEVLIWGAWKNHTADNIAIVNNTINYEVTCAVGQRVPRIYMNNGRPYKNESFCG